MGAINTADEYYENAKEYFDKGEIKKAVSCTRSAIGMYRRQNDCEQMADALNFLGIIYSSMGDISMAVDCYMEAIDIAVDKGYEYVLLLVNNNIGSIYQDLGKYEKAITYFESAMQYNLNPAYKDKNKYYNRMLLLNLNLCISYTGINDFETAEKYLSEAITYSEILNTDACKFFIDISQAHLLWKTGNEDEVKAHIDELVDGAISNISISDFVLEILSLCNLFMDMGEFGAWKQVITAYEQFANDINNIFFKKVCVQMRMKYERATGDLSAYNRLCVDFVNLSTQQENIQIERLGDTVDLKLQLQAKEMARRNAVNLNYTDMLTGLGNKYKLKQDFEELVSDGGCSLTVGIVDIDYFKAFNRNSGHVTGDEIIKIITDIIQDSIGQTGKGYHFYGDEFYVLLKEADEDKIKGIAEDIQDQLSDKQIIHPASKASRYVTVSQAYVICRDIRVPDEFGTVFKSVDKELQEIKEKGRNAYAVVEVH